MCVKLTCLFFAEYNTDMPIPLCERRLRGWHCNRGLSGVCVPSNKGARIVLNQDKLTTRRAKSARPPFGMLTVMDDRTFAPPPSDQLLPRHLVPTQKPRSRASASLVTVTVRNWRGRCPRSRYSGGRCPVGRGKCWGGQVCYIPTVTLHSY